MRVPPPQPAARRCRRSCERHGSGSRSASHAGDAGVEDEAMHVGELRAERPREAQEKEAVRAHRPADIEQQDEARAHAAAVLPREPQRRAAAPHAPPDRAREVETAAAMEARFAAQSRCFKRRAKRRISASMSRTSSARSRSRKSVEASDSSRLATCRAMPSPSSSLHPRCIGRPARVAPARAMPPHRRSARGLRAKTLLFGGRK